MTEEQKQYSETIKYLGGCRCQVCLIIDNVYNINPTYKNKLNIKYNKKFKWEYFIFRNLKYFNYELIKNKW